MIVDIASAGHRHFCLYGFLQHDWSRQNQNKRNLAERNWVDLDLVHGNVNGGHISTRQHHNKKDTQMWQ